VHERVPTASSKFGGEQEQKVRQRQQQETLERRPHWL